VIRPLLQALVRRVRQNHALEHATMHMLAGRAGGGRLAGCTVADGFVLLGPVRTADVQGAVSRALIGLRRDPSLAVHPRCGTNLVALYVLAAGLVAFGARQRARGARAWIWRGAAIASAALLARPAGLWAQRHITTTGRVERVSVGAVRRFRFGSVVIHHVATRDAD
jgi:hypothetical protein